MLSLENARVTVWVNMDLPLLYRYAWSFGDTLGLSLLGAIALVWYHPAGSPAWAIWGNLVCQLLAHVLTAIFWGRWQAKLSTDPLGSESPFLDKILGTHWIRTVLTNAYAVILFIWTIRVLQSSSINGSH
jgi:hypothetical protein